MHGIELISDLAIVMTIAGAVAVLFHRLHQPVVLGYIVAGLIIGPHTPPFELVSNHETIETLADLGVVFLMFSLGLEFRLQRLRAVGTTAFLAASLEIVVMVGLGYEIGEWLGWGDLDSIFLGAMIAISSTTIIVKTLKELGLAREPFAELVFGILIVEDILAIAMLALLSGIAMTGTLGVVEIGTTLLRLGVFLATLLVVGLLALPPLLGWVARLGRDEMLLVVVLGLCFGASLVASKMGYSIALGAFVMGAIMAESEPRLHIERLAEPVRDLFSAVFFVAIGMLIDPAALAVYAVPITVLTVAVVLGKIGACSLGTLVAGHPLGTSLKVGMGLAQIGEFSFIIAALGTSLHVTSDFLYPIAVAVSAITTLLTPYLIRAADPLAGFLERVAPESLASAVEAYTGRPSAHEPVASRGRGAAHIRRLAGRVALGLALVVAIFASTGAIAAARPVTFPGLPDWCDTRADMAELAAVILCLPLLLATLAGLRRLSIHLARAGVRRHRGAARRARTEVVVSRLIFLAAGGPIVVGVVLVSRPALPGDMALFVWVAVLAAASVFLWRPSLRLHRAATRRLRRTLSAEHPPHP